jgi:hypothetical protein
MCCEWRLDELWHSFGLPEVAGSRPHLASVFQGKKEKQ